MYSQAISKNQKIYFNKFVADQVFNIEVAEIRIILKNLLDSAIKFTPIGGDIDIDLLSTKSEVKWIVRNEGIPMLEEIQ